MAKEYLGEFEELVLLIVALMKDHAYGLAICDEIESQTDRKVTIGAVHATVARLEQKGFVETFMSEATKERGGRRKRMIQMTSTGKETLVKSRDAKMKLWTQIPGLSFDSI